MHFRLSLLALTVAVSLSTTSCGTSPHLRSADTLSQGQSETLVGGTGAIGAVGAFSPIIRSDYGITEAVEIDFHFEPFFSLFGGTRFGLLKSKSHGFGLALGAEAGWAGRDFNTDDDGERFLYSRGNWVFGPNLTLGAPMGPIEIYLSGKVFLNLTQGKYAYSTVRSGVKAEVYEQGALYAELGYVHQSNVDFTNHHRLEVSAGVSFRND